MRKLAHFDVPGTSIHEILEEFNERREEFDVEDEDIISVNVLPPEPGDVLHAKHGGGAAKVRVVIVYWS